ncbi:MAG: homoserine kinase [Bacteroidetes bacterium]|nr:homoserine kinase [Bacteroidota bacterium]
MNPYKSVTAFAPATVANVSCGFDIMGFAIKGIGDKVTISLQSDIPDSPVILSGNYGHLIPSERIKNTAGVAVNAFLKARGNSQLNVRIELEKNMPLGSGMGSSASSSAAAVFALNHLLGCPLSVSELIPFAMEGERIACGAAHADNVAPALLGGFVLIRSYSPLDIISVSCPDELFCTLVHPHIELQTIDARRILKNDISMEDVVKQSANAASFMVALLQNDYNLLGRSMHDLLAEPKRTQLIPGFENAKHNALNAGAIGCGISGSGPSLFALCRSELTANIVAKEIKKSFLDAGLESDTFISSLNAPGACIVNTK